MTVPAPRTLSRASGDGAPAAPVRMLHLGMGNFFRAHQAWYTDRAPDAGEWGIAAFTGRRPGLAGALSAQGGLYTLVTRDSGGDRCHTVSSLAAVHPGGDSGTWLAHWRLPGLAVVTLTVTEAGYTRRSDGSLDTGDEAVVADIAALRAGAALPEGELRLRTAVGKVLAGLAARDAAGLGAVALVPCDNLPGNGAVLERALREMAGLAEGAAQPGEFAGRAGFAESVRPGECGDTGESGRPGRLTAAIDRCASCVTTMVDRITPGATDEDRAAVTAATGLADAAPVVTEPFTEWVVSGEFPAGRPRWEEAGVRFVDDVTPYEQRKLWLLNGAHSLLAYAGSIRGHTTVADAVADPVCRGWLEEWWSEASCHLALPAGESAGYREALLGRFANPRIRHPLAQIAGDGSQKLPVRVLPVLLRERARGVVPPGAVRVLAAWICHLRGMGAPVTDPAAEPVRAAAGGPLRAAVREVLAFLHAGAGGDGPLVDAVVAQTEMFTAARTGSWPGADPS